MDVLSSVLREMRIESTVYRRFDLRAPWRLSFRGGVGGVHIVVRGRCEISVDGAPTCLLEAGDLVVVARPEPHIMCSVGERRGPLLSAIELAERAGGAHVRWKGKGDETIFVCGAFLFHETDHPAMAALPRLIHVPGSMGRASKWLSAYTEALTSEVFEGGPGSDVVMARISDALVARALRFHAERAEEPGWLRGLRDPHLAKALGAVHDDLARSWSLVSLARTAGLSRAAFAARFAHCVGDTPMHYLLACRMRRAATMLRDEHATLAQVARAVGYGSEAALSAAFKRHTRVAPGAYARTHRARTTQA